MAKRKLANELQILEEILKRNCESEEELSYIDFAENEVDYYFYFDRILNPDDLETAWSLFPESTEIRIRLQAVEDGTNEVPGFGYRVPLSKTMESIDDLVRDHLRVSRELLVAIRNDCEEEIELLNSSLEVALAPPEIAVPPAEENRLFLSIYESIQELLVVYRPRPSKFPNHYDLLYYWAIYLTKCDEVALYLLWPCLEKIPPLPADTPDYAFHLWKAKCRDRYWIKDNDIKSGVVYFRPPWLDS